MRVIVAYRAASPDLMLSDALSTTDVELAVDRTGSGGDESGLRFWAAGSDLDGFETAMDGDRSLVGVRRLCRGDVRRLYSGTATDRAAGLTPVATGGGTPLSARFAGGWWHAVTEFPAAETFAAFREDLADRDVTVELESVYDARERPDRTPPRDPRLTDRQRETLELAYQSGFFEVPRDATMGDLAVAFDVSEQAISQRLRRAYARLVEAAVVD